MYSDLEKQLSQTRNNKERSFILTNPIDVTAETRYSQHEAEATKKPLNENMVAVIFRRPQRASAKGQASVFYNGDIFTWRWHNKIEYATIYQLIYLVWLLTKQA